MNTKVSIGSAALLVVVLTMALFAPVGRAQGDGPDTRRAAGSLASPFRPGVLSPEGDAVQPDTAVHISEGFEGGVVPPTGWTRIQTNPRQTWKIMTLGTPYAGSYAADVEYDVQLAYQNEILLSPYFTASAARLRFYSFGSLHWCRDTYDNCDLNVWLVIGAWGGGNDIYLYTADDDWTATWAWSLSEVDLTPYLPSGVPVRVAFQYEGQDGAQIALDAIELQEFESYLPVVSRRVNRLSILEGFEGGVVPPTGWTRVQFNPRQTWKIMTLGTPYAGSYAADVEYDDQLGYQDEVLLSPYFTASSATLRFYSFGSLYWCRDTYDNCDLDVWLVIGAWGGGNDIYLYTADDDWTATWTWSPSEVDLTPYLSPGVPVRVAFQYGGQDGAQIALDAIRITGASPAPVSRNDQVSAQADSFFHRNYSPSLSLRAALSGASAASEVEGRRSNLHNAFGDCFGRSAPSQ